MGRSVVLGFFDGVHTGHRAVISSAMRCSKNDDIVLVTLKNSPSLYFNGAFEYIFPRYKSYEKIKSLGVSEIVELEFGEVVSMSAVEYIEFLLKNFSPKYIVSGFNHTFGANKSGTPELLKLKECEYGYKYICVQPVFAGGEAVSSTRIKQYLSEGDIEKANILLESCFELEGNVIHGEKIGRTIGFPTANISYPKNIVKIPYGVYAAECDVDGKAMRAVLNWGMKPTVNNTAEPVIEVHILGFNGDLYDKNINVKLLKRIRSENKFSSLDELKTQIKKDAELCLKL